MTAITEEIQQLLSYRTIGKIDVDGRLYNFVILDEIFVQNNLY